MRARMHTDPSLPTTCTSKRAGDVGGIGENEDGAGDEMGDRDAFDAWTGDDGVVGWETNKGASSVVLVSGKIPIWESGKRGGDDPVGQVEAKPGAARAVHRPLVNLVVQGKCHVWPKLAVTHHAILTRMPGDANNFYGNTASMETNVQKEICVERLKWIPGEELLMTLQVGVRKSTTSGCRAESDKMSPNVHLPSDGHQNNLWDLSSDCVGEIIQIFQD
ncbi:hypothetical protein HD554DRAFT_2042688 [Boletus coccyginus]|nr:hypothetical protein HD554DRAFT_2042688 [Boletus coccyginus]